MGPAVWEELPAPAGGPEARSSHAVAVVGVDVAYVFGGEHKPRVPLDNHLYALDLHTRTWSIARCLGSPPPPRVGVTMLALQEMIYVFGGRDERATELDDLYAYDTRTSIWRHLEKKGGPRGRSYHAMVADPSRKALYVFGGCGSAGRLSDLWSFHVEEEEWEALPLPPPECLPRGGPGLAVVGRKVYVIFGFSGKELNDIWSYDLESRCWEQLQCRGDVPSARSVFGTAVVGDCIVIYGGEVDPSDKGHEGAGSFSSEVFVLDTKTCEWRRVDVAVQDGRQGPGARGWFAAAAFANSVLVYGGNSDTNARLNDLHLLTFQ